MSKSRSSVGREQMIDVAWVAGIVALAFVLRWFLLYAPGFGFDVGVNQGWAKSAVLLGPIRSYREQVGGTMLPNYPPFSILIFTVTGYAYKFFASATYENLPVYVPFIKFPGLLADVCTTVLLYDVLQRTRGNVAARIGGVLYALHPAVFYNSAVWGQVDSVAALLMVASIAALMRGRAVTCGVFAALAVLTKMQSVVLLPVIAVALMYRPRLLLKAAIAGATTTIVIVTPFVLGGSGTEVMNVYLHSVGYYPNVTVGALNAWTAFFGLDIGWRPDGTPLLFALTYRQVGLALFGIVTLALLWVFRRRLAAAVGSKKDGEVLMIVTGLIAFAFFLFNTEMHERYLFAAMPFLLPLIFLSLEGALTYAFVSLGFFLNLLASLPIGDWDKAMFTLFANLRPAIGEALLFLFFIAAFVAWRGESPWASVTARSKRSARS